ncbi:MAG: hypothetical protein AAFX50_20545, partial [Acidobacteriota bacterium]
ADGQVAGTHSVSAGLDYPAVGPEHALLRDEGRVEYVHASDQEAIDAFHRLSSTEGILPALETAHALAHVEKIAPRLGKRAVILVNLSGRGDKDVESVLEYEASKGSGSQTEELELARIAVHPAARKWANPSSEEDPS